MKDAAAHRDQHSDHPTDDEAAPGPDWDPDWIYDPAERTDLIAAAMRENHRLFRLAVATLTLWQGELQVDSDHAPDSEIASVVVGLLRCCELRGRLHTTVAEAFVTIAEALGISRAEGWENAERRVMGGSLDRGDVAGIPNCMELKNTGVMEMGRAVAEAEKEAKNAGARWWCVIFKRRRASISSAYVVIDLEQWSRILRILDADGWLQ